ncbi:MAG: hypothetical protein PHO61_03555, partial [Candidatus ainarchaeum sp.]|nr:hypothetical protein [Candidatus ainarchaeum sp.]
EHGKETVALVAEEMSAAALKNTADKVVFLKGKKIESKNDKIDHKKDSPRTTTNLNQKLVTVQPKVDEKKESKS